MMESRIELGYIGLMVEQIRIHVLRHKTTGLLLAVSDDLKGLNVAARTLEEILTELPPALELLLGAIEDEALPA